MKFYFAPLEGVTGYTYRNAFSDIFGGPDKYYAPFVSPSCNDRLKGKEIRDLLPENNSAKVHLIPQILTNRSEYFIKTTNQLMELGYTEEININMGCPSGTVVAKKKGSGFLTELDEMDRFFDEIFNWREQKGDIQPDISVKTRIGRYHADEFIDILEIYNRYPISELIVHPRTRNQMYRETPDMEAFTYAVNNSRNPICYNGDIKTVAEYRKIAENYNIDAVMLGRGLIANPNLINEIRGGAAITKTQIKEYHDRLYSDFEEIMNADRHLLFKMKEFWNYVSWNFEEEHKCAKLVRKALNLYKYKLAIHEIFSKMELKKL